MKTIANTIRNNKYNSIIPLIMGLFILLLLLVKFSWILVVLALIAFSFSFAVYVLATKKWKIEFDEQKEELIIIDKRKKIYCPLTNVSNIHEYSHFSPRGASPYTNYALTLVKPLEIGKVISFSILDRELELKENYFQLRSRVVLERSKKVKQKINNAGNTQ